MISKLPMDMSIVRGSGPLWYCSSELVVGDRVEEVMVARVEHGVDHRTRHTKHGSTAVLDFDVEDASALFRVGNLRRAGVSTGDETLLAVVSTGKILWATRVLGRRYSFELGDRSEEHDLSRTSKWSEVVSSCTFGLRGAPFFLRVRQAR